MTMNARDKLIRGRTQLVLNLPIFGYLSLLLRMKEVDGITVGVDSEFNLYYSKKYVDKLSEREAEGVLLHEVLHLALAHMMRSKGMDKALSNIAQDIVINNIISKSSIPLPQTVLIPHNDRLEIKTFNKTIVIENISKKSFEQIYDELEKQIDKVAIEIYSENSFDNNSYDRGSGSSDDGSNNDDENNSDNNNDNKNKSVGEIKRRIKEELHKEVIDNHDKLNGMNKEQQKKLEEVIKQKLIEAYENTKNRGDIPAEILRLIKDLTEPKLSWKQILYLHITNNLPSRYTYNKPSKKSYTLNVYLPRLIKEDVELVIAIDTSGSISDKELTEFFSELKGIVNGVENVNAKLIFADSKVHSVVDFNSNTNINDIMKYVKGGGGTSHIPVFEYIENNMPNTKLIICFTDGYTIVPDYINIPAKVLWVITKDGTDEHVKKLGTVVFLD